MRKTLTDKGVAALKPRAARYAEPDPQLRGHYVRVQPSGAKSFVAVARDPDRQADLDDDRRHRRADASPRRASRRATPSSASVPGCRRSSPRPRRSAPWPRNWLKRHVEANGLRSSKEIKRLLDVHVLPAWRDREFTAIRRSDVAALLDDVEDDHGARQADYVLNVVRSIMNWYATRHDDYTPPIVRGMRRQKPKAQARARILDDDEIRQIWKAAESQRHVRRASSACAC